MRVDSNPAYTSPLYTRTSPIVKNTDTGQASTPAPSQSPETAAAVTAKTNAVTGTTGSRLSAETTAELIKSSQQANTSAPVTHLAIAIQHHLDEIANNPSYASSFAQTYGSGPILLMANPPPKMPSDSTRVADMAADLNAAFKERQVVYKSKTAEGLPPAQVYSEMLALSISQTEHNARADHYQGDPVGTRSSELKAEYAYLQNAIAKASSAESIG